MNPGNPKALFRKNSPQETRDNWTYSKGRFAYLSRLLIALLILPLLILMGWSFYGFGYFQGTRDARAALSAEIISNTQESKR